MNATACYEDLPPAPRQSAGPTPFRQAGSVRRTSSIDVIWPDGYGKPMAFSGRARDIYTPTTAADQIEELALDEFAAEVSPDRRVLAIQTHPPRPEVQALVETQGGGHFRSALNTALPAERDAGTPLYLLLDDLPGTSLISSWAWSRWSSDWMSLVDPDPQERKDAQATRHRAMEGVCIGFRPGSRALDDRGFAIQSNAPVSALPNPDDPYSWHTLIQYREPSMRRARRIDVYLDGGEIHIDSAFQDSATDPDSYRVAVHEYSLYARADPDSLRLTHAAAVPRVLPYPECTAAAANIARLVGTPLRELRSVVLKELRRTAGCTHLNDALRALADVPVLLDALLRRR